MSSKMLKNTGTPLDNFGKIDVFSSVKVNSDFEIVELNSNLHKSSHHQTFCQLSTTKHQFLTDQVLEHFSVNQFL